MVIDYDLLEKLTGITDREILTFYTEAIIEKIERIIGYSMTQEVKAEMLEGVNKNIVYLLRRPITSVDKVEYRDKEINYKWNEDKTYIILDFIVCVNDFVDVTYNAGYTEMPKDIMMLIAGLIKDEVASISMSGVKSYKIKDISYTFIDDLHNNKLFIDKITTIFGVF